jgi:putative ABC transport system ATP-binding protein
LPTLIHLNNILKCYGSQKIFKDLHFKIEEGQSIAIMGPSGSGKSTLLNIIGLMDTFSSGEYFLERRLLTDSKTWPTLRNHYFGFIFQAFHLLSYRTILDNVCLPLFYRELRSGKGEEGSIKDFQEKALEMLELVGLTDKAAAYPHQLSGGQQQRVAIARSLVTKPKILLADEPTGSLDQETAKQVMDLIFTLQAQHQMACLLVTHDVSVARRCDISYQLEKNGQLCAD